MTQHFLHRTTRTTTTTLSSLWYHKGPPVFLAPFLVRRTGAVHQAAQFSASAQLWKQKQKKKPKQKQKRKQKERDSNPNRGVSALRRTGLRHSVSMSRYPLPKPVLDPEKRSKPSVNENHGLWGFFNEQKTPLSTPEEDASHGRSWTVEELRRKSFEDLHALWWKCCKERNIIATQRNERKRIRNLGGDDEARHRERTIQTTQRAIKHTLTERYYAWEDARRVAVNDPEVNLMPAEDSPAYTPNLYGDDAELPEEELEKEELEEQPKAAASAT